MIRNHPALIQSVNTFSASKIAFENEVRNCEDVVLDEKAGFVIFSCDAGRDKWNTVMVSVIFPPVFVDVGTWQFFREMMVVVG